MGCGSRFWVGWAGVLGQSLVEFGSAFFHLWFIGWLRFFFFFFFPFWLRFLDFEFVAIDDNGAEIIYYFNV